MKPPLKAALLAVLFCLPASRAGAGVVEMPVVPGQAGFSANPASVALAMQSQLLSLAPFAGSPQLLAQTLQTQLTAPGVQPAQVVAGQYIINSLSSPKALPLVQDFIARAQVEGGAEISANLTALAKPYQNPAQRKSFSREVSTLRSIFKARGTAIEPGQMGASLDSLFENSTNRGEDKTAVDAGSGGSGSGKIKLSLKKAAAKKTEGPAVLAEVPRLGPSSVLGEANAGRPALNTGSFHENDPAKIIVMHEPGTELLFANGHPDSALFTDPVNWKNASAEHAGYREALKANGADVYLVKDVLLDGTVDEKGEPLPGPALDALRAFAAKSLKYDTRALKKEYESLVKYAEKLPEGPYKDDVKAKLAEQAEKITPEGQEKYRMETLAKLSPKSLVDLLMNQPTIKLHLQSRKGPGAFYVGFQQEIAVKPVMNLYFSRDQQITTQKGVVLANFGFDQRKPETKIMKFVFEKMGVPIVAEVAGKGTLDGGDFIPAGDLAFQGQGLRTNAAAIRQLLAEDAYGAKEVAVVRDDLDQNMTRMHLDTVFNVLSDKKVLILKDLLDSPEKKRTVDLYRRADVKGLPNSIGYYVKVEEGREFGAFLKSRGFKIATVTDAEQKAYALNFLNMGNGKILTPYGDAGYLRKLRGMGVDAEHVPMKCLTDGYGAAHCMTQVIHREPR